MIMLRTNERDKEALTPFCQRSGIEMPGIKISVYKNRRGRYKDVLLWCKEDLGICRINPVFATDYSYRIIEIPDIKININPKNESSAF